MKIILNASLIFSLVAIASPSFTPSVVWESTQEITNPESVLYNPDDTTLYISNINGDGTAKDKNGYISKISLDSKKVSKWATGLNAPKGMAKQGTSLWVSDIDELVEIDLSTGKVKQKLKIAGAKFLNDITADATTVYVSDTLGNQIFKYDGKSVSKFNTKENLESPNGLLLDNGKLLVASWGEVTDFSQQPKQMGRLFYLSLDGKKKEVLSKSFGNLDGLEKSGSSFIVSDWAAGKLYKVTSKGEVTLLKEGPQGFADIALYEKNKKTFVALPHMMENKVSLLELKN